MDQNGGTSSRTVIWTFLVTGMTPASSSSSIVPGLPQLSSAPSLDWGEWYSRMCVCVCVCVCVYECLCMHTRVHSHIKGCNLTYPPTGLHRVNKSWTRVHKPSVSEPKLVWTVAHATYHSYNSASINAHLQKQKACCDVWQRYCQFDTTDLYHLGTVTLVQ